MALRKAANPAAYATKPIRAGGVHSNAVTGVPGAAGIPLTPGQLYFSSTYSNYALSPLPNVNDGVNCKGANHCGIRKFIDPLSLPPAIAGQLPPNPTPSSLLTGSLAQQIPIAVADKTTFPGADYYEIELVQYTEKLHSDLPATMLRGYRQINTPSHVPSAPQYMGPLIIASSKVPVRVKFVNSLGSVTDTNLGTSGNLFIPEDKSVMGAGQGLARGLASYLDNRATIHLHGGATPWISDGTPHQWTVPKVDAGTTYPRGDSVQFVPDMFFVNGVVVPQCSATLITQCSDPANPNNPATLPANASNDPGAGALTFYYTNQQSARLMFYHDHAYGTTRLNVYIGEGAGYLLTDAYEADLVNGTNTMLGNPTLAKAIPAVEIPLVIQDKTFVPPNPASTTLYSVPILANGSGYLPLPAAPPAVTFTGGCSTPPAATATVGNMEDPYGQFLIGAVTGITLTSYGSGCTSDPIVAIGPPPVGGSPAAAFAYVATLAQQDPTWDSALWGGTGNLWYPHVYMPNQWPTNPDDSGGNPMGRWDYASWFWPPFAGQYVARAEVPCDPIGAPLVLDCPGTPTPMNPGVATELDGTTKALGEGSIASLTPEAFMDTPMVNGTVYPTLTVDPQAYRFRILSVGNDRSLNLSWFRACGVGANYVAGLLETCPLPTVAGIATRTEVGMVPATPTVGYPAWWPTDGRDGGVPNPAAVGPSWIAIGNEGGFLPAPAVIPSTPTNYEYSRRSVTVTNTSSVSLSLMPAERADVIVDFTAFAGDTLILYNDAPAPYPAFDPRYDYYTGDPDQSGVGGAPTTLAGFGPNTRTIMQVKVNNSRVGPIATLYSLAALQTALPATFKASQPVPVVPEPVYSAAYGQTFTGHYPTEGSTSMTFNPINPVAPFTSTPVTITYGRKTIQELFELDYGRMNATLGTELQLTNFNTQTTIPFGYVDPFTEDLYDSAPVSGQLVGSLGDGSQIWEVIHNGVDSHAIHFHLFNVEILDRVGWDGTLRAPLPLEQGWKDTVRMNPLEIDFVALRPMSMTLPFPVPDSTRLLDVTRPANTVDGAMSAFGPTNAAFSQMNEVIPMGWEYVWHCHILGHEENDMMREMVFQVAPPAPINLSAAKTVTGNLLTFTDMALSETGFTVQRAPVSFAVATPAQITTLPALPANLKGTPVGNPGWHTPVTYLDSSISQALPAFYRVQAFKPDAGYWNQTIGGIVTATLPNLVSAWTNVAQAALPILTVTPPSLTFASQPYLTLSAAQTVTLSNVGGAPDTLISIGIAGVNAADFSISANTCGTTLIAGASCTVSVVFTPQYALARAATLVIKSNDPANPTLNVGLIGTGGLVPLTITASSTSVMAYSPIPTITPIATGLVAPDTVASLGAIACSSTYTTTSVIGTYPSHCSGAVNPHYLITYVAGVVKVTQGLAVLQTPAVGSVLSTTNQQFTWNNGGGTSSYALWLGTTGVGSNNLHISPTSSALSATANLPANGIQVFARLYTLVGTTWLFHDYTFMESGTPVPPVLTAPALGSTLSSTSQTFTWTAGTGITSYQFGLGTTGVGSLNLYLSPRQSALTVTVTGLPANGIPVFARLSYLQGAVWKSLDYTFVESGAPAPPALTAPALGSALSPVSQTFTWTAGTGITSYQFGLGTTGVGSLNLYLSPRQSALTATVTALPANGVKVYARLSYLQGTVWKSLDYTFIESGTPTLPVLSSPNTFGTTFTTSSTTFTWTAGAGPTAYGLWVGTAKGAYNIYSSGTLAGTSTPLVTGIPIGTTVYVRLYYMLSGVWQFTDYTY
jgi:FtsP/CotA-like multicopper oxidase with cupredoxin domain